MQRRPKRRQDSEHLRASPHAKGTLLATATRPDTCTGAYHPEPPGARLPRIRGPRRSPGGHSNPTHSHSQLGTLCLPRLRPRRPSPIPGGLLLAAHASLRFGDLQRIQVTRLCLTSSALRGLCWATKTTRQGQPFAVTVMGFTGRDISTSWVVHWLRVLAQSLATEHCPDFALPSFSPSNVLACPIYNAPLAYSQALAALRWAAQTPWAPSPCLTESEASNLTLHSLKVTVLSAALQLRLPEDDRRVQGHHKLSSTRLYGRDDTRRSGCTATRPGSFSGQWRPQRPMARGGQQPTRSRLSRWVHRTPRHPGSSGSPIGPPTLHQRQGGPGAAYGSTWRRNLLTTARGWKRTPPSRGNRTPSPPPSTPRNPWTPARLPRGTASCSGWGQTGLCPCPATLLEGGPRGLAGQLRGDAYTYRLWVSPGRIQHHQGGRPLTGTLPSTRLRFRPQSGPRLKKGKKKGEAGEGCSQPHSHS